MPTGIIYRDFGMKAKLEKNKDLWLIGIVTILLVVVIVFFPSTVARIVLGLPFLLFFPGYTLIAALFPKKESVGGVERVALSFGLSIAVVSLIGLVLNFSPWKIRLVPVLISLAVFAIATAGIAWYRREKLPPEERFTVSFNIKPLFKVKPPFWYWQRESLAYNTVSLVLALVVAVAIASLTYMVATPKVKVGEKFTEFYILGLNGTAENYPTELRVGEEGDVIVGIVNHEQSRMSYRVEVWIDGEQAKLRIDGEDRYEIDVELENAGKWEQVVGFVPQKAGRQKVEFVLYREGEPYFKEPPYLWVDVEAA
jgi:uncharacterized membrane protein